MLVFIIDSTVTCSLLVTGGFFQLSILVNLTDVSMYFMTTLYAENRWIGQYGMGANILVIKAISSGTKIKQ